MSRTSMHAALIRSLGLAATLLLIPLTSLAAQGGDGGHSMARATLLDSHGDSIGSVMLTQTPARGVLLHVRASGLTPGVHAIHIHETGRCEAPDFSSAGGHYAPRNHAHGPMHPEGMHGGDLVNLYVPDDGSVELERLARDVTLQEDAEGSLFDGDGSAVMIHAGADDYRSQPSGDAGSRVACGVIVR